MALFRKHSSTRPTDGTSTHGYHLAALRLQLLVAMAASDGRVQMAELDAAARAIDAARVDEPMRERLDQLLRTLVNAPPRIEQIVGRIAACRPSKPIALALITEMTALARLDGHVDAAEERLLRLVCGALGLPPRTLRRRRPAPLTDRELQMLDDLLANVTPDALVA
ncbi:MAG: Tellurite resistance protein TerB [Thermoleophilia bacterium]|nr:Tellurite resistance protein TerB [Thermoleophilia bacterium]